ncbi:MAG TPA: hypothetical protein PK777_01570 [Thermoguttaceae bacterium]|nr:hypothetical protein [Thermoguttaceae bacterium]
MVHTVWSELEQRLWQEQPERESTWLSDWPTDPETCSQRIISYCVAQSEAARKEAECLINRLSGQDGQ